MRTVESASRRLARGFFGYSESQSIDPLLLNSDNQSSSGARSVIGLESHLDRPSAMRSLVGWNCPWVPCVESPLWCHAYHVIGLWMTVAWLSTMRTKSLIPVASNILYGRPETWSDRYGLEGRPDRDAEGH
jgi:hypothetical protein